MEDIPEAVNVVIVRSRTEGWYRAYIPAVPAYGDGETEEEALANLKEALELHFEPPQATRPPRVRVVEVEVGAA